MTNSKSVSNILKLAFEDDSVESISCMHVVEHIGLGRYGDPIDYEGDLKAISELARVVTRGGKLLFVVPVGHESHIQFNAHRIYNPSDIISEFSKYGLKLLEFCLIPENSVDGGLVIDPAPEILKKQKYACGCFQFEKS